MSNLAFTDSGPRRTYLYSVDGNQVGANVRRFRQALGWTQEELAERAELSSVKMIETGKRNPRLGTLRALAKAMGIRMEEMLGGESGGIPQALVDFLETPMAKGITDDEVELLQVMSIPGRRATAESYYNLLQATRTSEPAT